MSTLKSFKGIFPTIAASAYIDASSILVGNIQIGEDTSIWPFVSARGDVNFISIGNRSNIQDGSILHVTHKNPTHPEGYPLIIGNDVTVGHQVMLHGCTIKDRVLVGMASVVLDGALIENDVMIGAGSLVTQNKTLESGYLYMGRPAKKIRPLTKDEFTFLETSAANYVETKNEYLKGQ